MYKRCRPALASSFECICLRSSSFIGRICRASGEVVRFHVAPDPETGGYTGWIRKCVAAAMGLEDAPITNAESARA